MKGFLAALGLGLGLMAAPALAASPAEGTWRMSNGKITITVSPCGQSLCGTLSALKEPLDKNGNPKLDKHNPDPSKRGRSIIGISILKVQQSGDNSWAGNIYNADDGHTYNSTLKLNGDTMRVKGCFMVFCRNLVFNRIQ